MMRFSYQIINSKFIYLLLFLLAILSGWIYFWATELNGIGLKTDSIAYLWGAENISKGQGFVVFDAFANIRHITHWPPLYSALIAIPIYIFGISAEASAIWLGIFLTFSTFFLLGLLLHRFTNQSFFYTIFGLVLLAFSPIFWQTYLYAMSEPLFIVLVLATIYFFYEYWTTGKTQALIWTGIFLGVGLLARYAALYLVFVIFVYVLFESKHSFRETIKKLFILGLPSFMPVLAWSLRNYFVKQTFTNRSINLEPLLSAEIENFLVQANSWFAPIIKYGRIALTLLPVLFFVGVILVAIMIHLSQRTRELPPRNSIFYFLVFCLGSYSAFIIFSRLFVDSAIPIHEDRIFFPVYFHLLLIFVYGFSRVSGLTKILVGKRSSFFSTSFALLILSIFLWSSISPMRGTLFSSRYNGFGLNNSGFKTNSLAMFLMEIEGKEAIYFTDNVEKLYFVLKKPANIMFGSLFQNSSEFRLLQKDYTVVVVLFRGMNADERKELLNAEILFDNKDGSVVSFPQHHP
jgi:4-amino-4-deoxy-L-arabinose transferase-like glycosyltransferase